VIPTVLRTKIVCTIGPASRESPMLVSLLKAGMNVARLNFSHGGQTYHGENIQQVRAVAAELGKPVAILTDLQGPKLRIGTLPEEGLSLQPGQEIVLTTETVLGQPHRVPVQYDRFPHAVAEGDHVLIDDGLIELLVLQSREKEVACRVLTGGLLQTNKGMNLPRASLAIPAITPKDREDLRFILEKQVDWVALSFVRTADEVLELKQLISELSAFGRPTPVIAKIEKPEAVDNIDDIIAAADGIMVARGDLGIETAPETVPMVQKTIIAKCNAAGRPVITATQMLDSMIRNPRPTRAEASDVANAILDGTDAIMLSGETAVGKYPLRAVQTMVRIAQEAERTQGDCSGKRVSPRPPRGASIAEAVSHATCETARDLQAAAIIAPTVSGHTARVLSRFRPCCPVVAVTPSPITQRQLQLYWGVYPLLSRRSDSTDDVIADAVDVAQRYGFVAEGDVAVVTAGAAGSAPGTTNLMKVHNVERVLVRGIGLGTQRVTGRVRRLEPPLDADVQVHDDEIVVTSHTDRTFLPVLRRAAGLVSSKGGPDDHCGIVALEVGIPAVVSAEGALEALHEDQVVVLDASKGAICER
jgi:pyruvate kinase